MSEFLPTEFPHIRDASSPAAPRVYSPNAIHLVRTAQQVTMQLSQMADQKASILMGATFVVFTVSIGQAARSSVPWALGVLALFAFGSALLAVMAVLPRVTPSPDLRPDGNILFFSNFAGLEEADFITAIKARMQDDDMIYTVMLRDMYQNGVVLARRKYRYLAYAYRVFIIGLTCSFVIFVGEWLGLVR